MVSGGCAVVDVRRLVAFVAAVVVALVVALQQQLSDSAPSRSIVSMGGSRAGMRRRPASPSRLRP